MNKVLIIGTGGREHTLAWKLSQSPQVSHVYVAPGNAGMEAVATRVPINQMDFPALAAFAKQENITLTIPGPEAILAAGIVDHFEAQGLKIFGPNQAAAIIEGSKSFAKELMEKYDIPTAGHKTFTDYASASKYIRTATPPFVLKADGLAEGKGVIITDCVDEADAALMDMLQNARFGQAGKTVVIEEFLQGEEFSYMAFVNGENVYPMIIAQDHKRAFDGDQGPNTGGMGAYSPVPQISEAMLITARRDILQKTATAMVKEGRPFTGILYAGLIATDAGPKVIEFNARFGDPETEVVLPLLDGDLYAVFMDILDGKTPKLTWCDEHVVGVVMASKGYPGKYETGFPISGLTNLHEDTLVFHSATGRDQNGFTTAGGRVLFVARRAATREAALEAVYQEIPLIQCENLFYRQDIGRKAT